MCQRLQYLLYVHLRQAQKIERVERESKRIVHILYKPKNYFVREEKVWMITENMQKKTSQNKNERALNQVILECIGLWRNTDFYCISGKFDILSFHLQLALQNALRYFPHTCHCVLAPEFATELRQYGHIYMYRFRPDIQMR